MRIGLQFGKIEIPESGTVTVPLSQWGGRFGKDGQVDFYPEFLDEISIDKIAIRLLRNLKNSYGQSFAYEKAMRCTNMILSLEPNSPEEIRDKGILEDRFSNHDLALEFLEKYLEQFPEAEDADFILELIRNIRNKINQ